MAETNRRILQIVADGTPGGGTTAVLGLCVDLRDAGWAVTLATDRGSYAACEAARLGLDVAEVDFFVSRLDWRLAARLRAVVRRSRPQLIHANGARAGRPATALRTATLPVVYTVHGYHFAQKTPVFRRLGLSVERMIAAHADHVVFVAQADAALAHARRIRPRGHSVIHNGIDPSDLAAPATPLPSRELVFIGRMHRQKNPMFALDVMAALNGAPVRLLMVGGGDLEAAVRAAAIERGLADRIEFTGALPRDRAVAALHSAQLFFFPSLWEGLPIGPIEALCCGVPVIGSAIAGTDEVVRDGETGVLIEGFDADAYARAITALLGDPARLQRMREAGMADVAQRFTRARSSAAHDALYAQLLGRSGPASGAA